MAEKVRKGRKPKKCPVCHKVKDDIEWGPDPYADDIHNDDTPVWECGDCRKTSADEI